MAFVAVDKDGDEFIYSDEPFRDIDSSLWQNQEWSWFIDIPSGTIKKLIGRDLSWDDDPVELT